MSALVDIVASKVKAEVVRLLFGVWHRPLFLREIVRQSGLALGTVQQELRNLTRTGLLFSKKDGNRVLYWANQQHPVYPEIHNLVLKTNGLVELFRTALQCNEIRVAFIFGSIASGLDNPGSDIDLMVIGTVGLRTLSRLLQGLGQTFGREINPHVLTLEEWTERKVQNDHFVKNVMTSPKLYIVGDTNELETLGR